MSAPSLPSFQELQDAANNEDVDKCQELVLQALMYGTETHEALEERTREACKVLADAWEDCLALEDTLVDALWLRGSILTSTSSDDEASKSCIQALVEMIKILVQIPDRNSFWTKLQGNLMPSLVEASGLASEQELLKKLKMNNTQVHYKQQKYNLLQEESEGYSKMLHFLTSGKPGDAVQSRSYLRRLLGTFELDPNRVLDLAIDILEAKLFPHGCSEQLASKKPLASAHIAWLLDLMKELSLDKLPALIGFKLAGDKSDKGPSPGLLLTIAFLAAGDLLDLKTMMHGYFEPIEDKVKEAHKVLWMKEKRRIQALSRVSLSGAPKEDPKQAELAERLEQCLAPLESSELIKLLLVLLEWGEWNRAKPLLPVNVWSQLCSLMPEKVGSALCDVAQELIEPLFRSRVGTLGLSKPWKSDDDAVMSDSLSEMTVDQVVEAISEPLLCTVQSACISFRPVLFCQLCRVFRILLSNHEAEYEMSDESYNFFKTFLVPSLSHFPANPAISTELWAVLKLLPYATRYRLYEEWRGSGLERAGLSSSSTGKPLLNVEREMEAGKAVRYSLKRISKDNIRDMSRQFAKVTHSNPLVVFTTILNQIESYDNMVELMVEAQRFANPLGLDVLGYCILSRLSGMTGGVNRNRLKEDGVNVSQWLQSLETFSGAFFKRFPFVEFRGMLCYLMRRLREGNVMELGILRTLLKITGGYSFADYSPAASLSVTQLEGRAGSITLKRETISFGIVEETNRLASERIRHVLQTDGFGVSMLILIAQVRSRILFGSTKGAPKEVKLIGNLYDSCQVVMTILLEFLTDNEDSENGSCGNNISILKYAENLPTLEELHKKFGFDVVSTWTLCRPLVRSATGGTKSEKTTDGKAQERLKCFALTEEFRKVYQAMLPDAIWSVISPELFELFYSNSVYDLFSPESVYTTEINRVDKEIERTIQRQKGGASSSLHVGPPAPQKNEGEELDRLKSVSQTLTSDLANQNEHVASVLKSMEGKKSTLFKSAEVSRDAANAFLVHCIYPRSTQSPNDAMYCARFVFQLHKLETPGFSTLHYIDELISVVSGSLFGVTEGEAANLAILLWETWKVVNRWRYEEGLYDEEVLGKPGSYMLSSDCDSSTDGSEEKQAQGVPHEDFVALYNSWHASLGATLIGCLKSSEYMHTRAGLVTLTRIVEVFPTRPKLGNKLLRVLAPLQDESSLRPDIRASANAYGTMLLKARAEGKWVEEDAAVAKAREEMEKAAVEARKKKIAEQFQELERDSAKITDQIGPRDGQKDRFGSRREPRDYGTARGAVPAESERARSSQPSGVKENGKNRATKDEEYQNSRMESGEVASRERRDPQDRRTGPREAGRPRDSRDRLAVDERLHGRNDTIGSPGRPGDRQHGADNYRREEPGGTGGRWPRNESAPPLEGRGRGAKRSREPSPELGTENRGEDRVRAKRPRFAQDPGPNYDTRRGNRVRSRSRSPTSPRRSPPRGAARPQQRARRNRR